MDMNVVALQTEKGSGYNSIYVTLGQKDGFRVAMRPTLNPVKHDDGRTALAITTRIRVTELNPELPFDEEKAKQATGLKYLYKRGSTDKEGREHGSVLLIRKFIIMPFSMNEATDQVLSMGLADELVDYLYETLTIQIEPDRAKLVQYVEAILDKAFTTLKTELVEDNFTLQAEAETEEE